MDKSFKSKHIRLTWGSKLPLGVSMSAPVMDFWPA